MWALFLGTAFVAGIMGGSAAVMFGVWYLYKKLNQTGWF